MNNSHIQKIARYGLGTFLMVAGIGHLTFARKEFQAQVPDWVPISKDDTVVYSGFAEIALGAAGNIAQYKDRRDGFGLDTDGKRLARLFFQPVLVAWALKSTGKR